MLRYEPWERLHQPGALPDPEEPTVRLTDSDIRELRLRCEFPEADDDSEEVAP